MITFENISYINDDCLTHMRDKLLDNLIDVIVTSPPYNLGIRYRGYDDGQPRREYLNWLDNIFVQLKRILKEDGSLFLNVGGSPSDPLVPEQVLSIAVKHFLLQNKIYWIKSISIPTDTDSKTIGHFKPINSSRFLNDCVEVVYHLTKTGNTTIDRLAVGVKYEDKSNLTRGTRGKNGDKRCKGNAWFIPYETIHTRSSLPHPATFPIALAEQCYKLHGLDRIKKTLDPFSGMGSSAIAAKNCDIPHIGIEISQSVHEDAIKRFKEKFSIS